MPELIGIGTSRGYSMIGLGIGFGVSGYLLRNSIAPVLDFYPSSTKSLTPSIGPTPSFSRASAGPYFDASGVYSSATTNTARFTHKYNGSTWGSSGLLIGGQSTNLFTYGNTFSNGVWSIARGAFAQNVASPDGTTNAWTATCNQTGGGFYVTQTPGGTTASGFYTFGIFAKAGNNGLIALLMADSSYANYITQYFNLGTGAVSGSSVIVGNYTSASTTVEPVGNGWYWCALTANKGSSNGITAAINLTNDSTSGTCTSGQTNYFYRAQIEPLQYPSLPLGTAGAQVTRSADVCSITGGSFSGIWNASEGTFVFEGICPATGTLGLLSVNDGTANERMELYASSTDPKFIVVDGGVTQADIDGGTLTANTAFKIACRYKANDFAVSVNGGAAVTDTVGTLPTVTQMMLGANQAGNYMGGTISRVRYFNVAYSDAILQSLST